MFNQGFSETRLTRIDQILSALTGSQQLAGTVSLVVRHGEVVHKSLHGVQDLASQVPMQLDSIFRIYSMTKPIVSVGFMMLVEQGLVQLHEPISKWLPEFGQVRVLTQEGTLREPSKPISFHHLLTHTAGFSYGFYPDSPVDFLYRDAQLWDRGLARDEWIHRAAKLPLVFDPGAGWRYSIATDLLGLAIENMTGRSLGEYLQATVLAPLDMSDTGFSIRSDQLARFTTSYAPDNEGTLIATDSSDESSYHNVALQSGGGGLLSTVGDYAKFAAYLLNGGRAGDQVLIGSRTLNWMTRDHLRADHLPMYYNGVVPVRKYGFGFGFGFRVHTNPGQSGVLGSTGSYGWGGAANTVFWIDPSEALFGILMTQIETDELHHVRNLFRTLVYQALID